MPAQARQEARTLDEQPTVGDVALTPLSDLNLRNDPIPDLLVQAREQPYDDAGVQTCGDVLRHVADLDAILGDDYDTLAPQDRDISATRVAQRIVGSFIPFRGIIREITGANDHERDFREAIAAGMMRRAYLKGRGQAMGCDYPARPAPPELIARLRAIEAAGEDAPSSAAGTEFAANDGAYVSEPVIQPTP